MEQIKGYDSWKTREPSVMQYGFGGEEKVKKRKKSNLQVVKQLPFVTVKIDNGKHKELY